MVVMFRRFVLLFIKRNNLLYFCKIVSFIFLCVKFNILDNYIIFVIIKCKGSGNINSYLLILSVGGFVFVFISFIDDNSGDDSNSDDEIEFSEGFKRKYLGIFYSIFVFLFVNRIMVESIWFEIYCYFILRLRYMVYVILSFFLNIIR